MKIALAQLNYTIGAFSDNINAIIKALDEAQTKDAELVVFSELSVCGYPPLDLLEHKIFIDHTQMAIEKILPHTKNIAAVIGAPTVNKSAKGKNLFNSALFLFDGEIKKTTKKALLPTYDIFDEYRYFQSGNTFEIFEFKGKRLAITICEDLWFKQPLLTNFGKDKLYITDPMEKLAKQKPDLVINIAASPFAYNQDEIKSEILSYNAKKYKIPVIYVNQVGAHTELLFDGASRVIGKNGDIFLQMPSFKESIAYCNIDELMDNPRPGNIIPVSGRIELIHDALVMGIRDYFSKMGFKQAVIGLSGGIDSAVTLSLACSALHAKNIRVLLLPSQFSSDHSMSDAISLANNLDVKYDIVSIKNIFTQFLNDLKPVFGNKPFDIAEENIQARIRGVLLMAISNKFGNLLLNTSNKSEAAVGYGTLYGDMNGGISVLGDVYKTDVYALAGYINRNQEIIPKNTLLKPPSAELRPDQKDSDSLPDYNILDKILYNYIELRKSADEIISEGYDASTVNKTINLVNLNEYKRFQTPPILRISSKAFGFGRRMPLVAKYS
jgi:NAD+ synthase (glutamine-hydrolysing)